jgi:riboflavin synthase
MFTGLVADKGTVEAVEQDGPGARLRVRTRLAPELAGGDSIAVNGVCLTAREPDGGSFAADLMAETLERSSLGPLAAGDEVNLELPLRAGDRLGGHVVQGHVDGVGEVERIDEAGFARVVRVAAPAEVLRYVVEKGSIAVDGVSLTVAGLAPDAFTVALIPTTLARTTLGFRAPGDTVNIEVDVVAKYVERLTGGYRGTGAVDPDEEAQAR